MLVGSGVEMSILKVPMKKVVSIYAVSLSVDFQPLLHVPKIKIASILSQRKSVLAVRRGCTVLPCNPVAWSSTLGAGCEPELPLNSLKGKSTRAGWSQKRIDRSCLVLDCTESSGTDES